MARGLIEGALGGLAQAAGGIAAGHIKNEQTLDLQRELSAMEEQRQLRIDEAREQRRVKGRQSDVDQDLANAPRKTAADAERLKTLAPVEAAAAAEKKTAEGKAQRESDAAFAGDRDAQAGVRARAQAQDLGGGERALRMQELKVRLEEAQLSAAEKKEIRTLLGQAAEERAAGNEEGAQQTEAIVRTKLGQGAKGSEKSYGDVVQSARAFIELADPIKNPDASDEERKAYAKRAAEMLTGVQEKRIPGAGASKSAAPYPDGTRLRGKDGQTYVVRGGKPVPESGRKASGTVTQE